MKDLLLPAFAVITLLVFVGGVLSQRLMRRWEGTFPQRSQMVWRVSSLVGLVIVLAMVILAIRYGS